MKPDAGAACDVVWAVVSEIPRGRVATYGQIAEAAGLPRRWRLVGRVLRRLPDRSAVPWHRVVNARGEISARGDPSGEREQARLLRAEGVAIGPGGRIDLGRFRWDGRR